MEKNGTIIREDVESVVATDFIPWEKLKGTTILVTVSAGLNQPFEVENSRR